MPFISPQWGDTSVADWEVQYLNGTDVGACIFNASIEIFDLKFDSTKNQKP